MHKDTEQRTQPAHWWRAGRQMCRRAPLFTPSRPHLQQLISKDEMWVFVCKLFWVCTRAVAMATAGKKQWRRAMREVVRWRRWGAEAIIGEGWRGHVLYTFSLLSCGRNIVRLLCCVLITQPLVHIVCKFSKCCPHEITCTHINTHRIMFHPL